MLWAPSHQISAMGTVKIKFSIKYNRIIIGIPTHGTRSSHYVRVILI